MKEDLPRGQLSVDTHGTLEASACREGREANARQRNGVGAEGVYLTPLIMLSGVPTTENYNKHPEKQGDSDAQPLDSASADTPLYPRGLGLPPPCLQLTKWNHMVHSDF